MHGLLPKTKSPLHGAKRAYKSSTQDMHIEHKLFSLAEKLKESFCVNRKNKTGKKKRRKQAGAVNRCYENART